MEKRNGGEEVKRRGGEEDSWKGGEEGVFLAMQVLRK